ISDDVGIFCFRYDRAQPSRLCCRLLGGHAQQGPGMGLVWRSLWSRADIRLAHGSLRRSPILWESRQASPIVNFRPLLHATSTLLPGLLQSLFGYDAYRAGLVMSPAGIFSIMATIGGGALIGL